MADVTGDLGGQPIELNNAATEATLKQLLAATLAMATAQSKTGKGSIDVAKLEKDLKKLADSTKKLTDSQKKEIEDKKKAADAQAKKTEADKKATAAQEKQIESIKDTIDILGKWSSAIEGTVGKITSAASGIANLGNSMTSAAAALSNIPIAGGILSSVFGAVAGSAEKSYQAFQRSASVGANFGGSITDMIDAASNAGMTFDQFSNLVAKNSEALALLGGSTSEGAKRLADLGKKIRTSPLGDELARLGYSTEQINEGFAKYSAMQARSTGGQRLSNEQLIAQTGEYLKNLDAVSKLTGKNKEALQAEEDARRRDAQFRVAERMIRQEDRKNVDMFMNSLPSKEMQDAFKEILATGSLAGPAAQKLAVIAPEMAQSMLDSALQARRTGTFSAQTAGQLDKTLKAQAEVAQNSAVVATAGAHLSDQYGGAVVGVMDYASRQDDLNEMLTKQAAEEEAARKKAEEAAAKGMSPENMKAFQERIAELSNRMTKLIGENFDTFAKAFDSITALLEGPLGTAFKMIVENIGSVVAGFVGLKIAMAVYQAKLKVEQMKAAQRGSSRTSPMYVEDVSGPDGVGAGGKGKGKGKKTAGGIGKVAKIGGAVGAVAGVAALAGDLSDIAQREKEGKLTADDAKEEKGGAIGSAAGGAGGAWAGAAAGAAVGSMVPVIGTAIGGLIGGAIGYWAGSKGGEAAGRAIATSSTSKKLDEERKKELETTKKLNEAKEEEVKKAKEAAEVKDKATDWSNPIDLLKRQFEQSKSTTSPAQVGTSATAAVSMGTPPPINQDQAKNMELIKAALQKQGITDPKYIAATLGNVMKETGGKSMSENLNYSNTSNDRIRAIFGQRAAGKSDAELDSIKKDPQKMGEMMYGSTTKIGQQMGNTEPGDGWKYRGRGFIQLTGKSNYAAASKAIYGDDRLVKNPDLVNDPAVAAEVSAWYMKKGQSQMAAKMGIDTGNMTQAQANLLATSQVAGRDIRGSSAYLQSTLDKVNVYSGQMAGIAGAPANAALASSLPSAIPKDKMAVAGSADAARRTMEKEAEDRRKQMEQLAQAKPETLNQQAASSSSGITTKPVQESAETLLASLNTKMDKLISITANLSSVNERQLSVQKGLSGNLFASV